MASKGSCLKLITLDLTGTVLKFRKPPLQEYKEFATSKYALDVSEKQIQKAFKESWDRMNVDYPNFGSMSGGPKKWWTKLVHDTMKDSCGSSYSKEKVDLLAEDLFKLYATPDPYRLYPDASRFIQTYLEHRSNPDCLKIGVITNFDRRIHLITDRLGLKFDFLICSGDVGCSKPDKRIFQKAIEQLSSEEKSRLADVYHVGDDLEKDYFGAKRAGWKAILLDREGMFDKSKTTNAPDAEDVCRDFDEASRKMKLLEDR